MPAPLPGRPPVSPKHRPGRWTRFPWAPVIFCLDRAGLVGEDGATHHGVFDLAYLRCIPNLIIFAPRNEIELRNILYTAQLGLKNPIAIRYPRGYGHLKEWQQPFCKIEIGKGTCLKEGNKIAILSVGTIEKNVSEAILLSEEKPNKKGCISHFDMRFIKPLDENLLHSIFQKHETIITVEDGVIQGGFGSAITEFAAAHHYQNQLKILGIKDQFIEHGATNNLLCELGLDVKSLADSFQFYT